MTYRQPQKRSKKSDPRENYRAVNAYIPEQYWWQTPVDQKDSEGTPVHELVARTARDIIGRQKAYFERDKRHVFTYMNATMRGLGPRSYSKRGEEPADFTYNLVQEIIESLMSHFATKKTRPQVLTLSGDPSLQKRARLMQQALDGLFYETKYYRHHAQSILDGAVMDFGGKKHFNVDSLRGLRPAIERIPPWEVLQDEVECFYGLLPNFGVQKVMAADALAARDFKGSLWEGVTEHLSGASVIRDDDPGTNTTKGKLASIVEYWHPETEYGAKDGKHFIGLTNFTALYEPWAGPVPATFFKWLPYNVVGWRGQGVVERLYELNEKLKLLVARSQKDVELSSVKIAIKKGSQIVKNTLTNEDYAILEYIGDQPPAPLELGMVPATQLQMQDRYISWGRDLIGTNEMMTQAQKPSGITANAALETLRDIQSARLAQPEIASDDCVLDDTAMLIRTCDEIDRKMGGKFEVMLKGPNGIKPMLWRDVRVEDQDYRLQIFPSNYLPMDPAAKLQKVIDLAGQVPELRPFFLDLLDFPDIQSKTRLLAAPTLWIMETLQKILEDNDAENCVAEPSWDQDLAISLCDKFIALAHVDEVEESRIELLRRFRDSCIANKKAETAAAQQAAMVNQMNTAAGPGQPMPLAAPTAAPAPVSAQPGVMQ